MSEISKDNLTGDNVELSGVEYVGVNHFGCEGCAFDVSVDESSSTGCKSVPCSAGATASGKAIIWVRKDSIPQEAEPVKRRDSFKEIHGGILKTRPDNVPNFAVVERDGCKGCLGDSNRALCGSLGLCASTQREDGKSVVFVRTIQPHALKPAPAVTPETNPKQAFGDVKAPLGLVPYSVQCAYGLAALEGSLKYGRWNYRVHPVEAMTYIHAALRHLEKWVNGQDTDPVTTVPHLANALTSIGILIDAQASGKLIDNRPPKQDVDKITQETEVIVKHLRELFKDHKPTHYVESSVAQLDNSK